MLSSKTLHTDTHRHIKTQSREEGAVQGDEVFSSVWVWITWEYKVHLLAWEYDLSVGYTYVQGEGVGIMGEKVISILYQVGLRGVDVYLDG